MVGPSCLTALQYQALNCGLTNVMLSTTLHTCKVLSTSCLEFRVKYLVLAVGVIFSTGC